MALEAVGGGSLFLLVQVGRLRRRLTPALGFKSMAAKIIILILALSFPACSVAADSSPESNWLSLIKESLGPSCAVSLTRVGLVQSGNNGTRAEQWFMQTCHGKAEYWVSYYPFTVFPRRASPYEIKRIPVSNSTGRPNISFEADGYAAAQFQR